MIYIIDREDYVCQHFRWNFTVNLAEMSFCSFGYGFISFQTFLPVLVSQFTDFKALIGLVGISTQGGWLLPQLFVAPWIENIGRKKPVVVRLAFFEKILYLVLAGLTFASFQMSPTLVAVLLLLICLFIGLAGGVTRVGWSELMASIFPPRARGKFFGIASFTGGLLSALGAYLGGMILSRYNLPNNYALTFFIGFCVIIFSWNFLLWIREPPPLKVLPKRISHQKFFHGLATLLKQDRKFAFFVSGQSIVILGSMALPFVAVFGRERFNLDGHQVGMLTASLLLGKSLLSPAFGWLGDRFSHRKVLISSVICQILGLGFSLLSTSAFSLYLAVFVLGATRASMGANIRPLVYEYALLERRPTYIGLSSTAFGLVTIVIPLLGGLVAQAFGYEILFVLSTLLSVVALFFYLVIVKEPS